MKLKKLIPRPENVLFLYTDVSKVLFIFVTKQSKNGRERFYSISYVNLMLECLLLRYF